MARDPIAEIVAYNHPLAAAGRAVLDDEGRNLTREALRRKLDALASSPFSFFRGTFHLMARDVLQDRVAGAASTAPEALIVGDLHVENFGVYRGANGKLSFDVNDFDDVGYGPVDLDLKRLCASVLLIPAVPLGARQRAARALAKAWSEGISRLGGRFPVAPFDELKAEPPVRALLEEHGKRTREELLGKVAEGKARHSLSTGGEPRKAVRPVGNWRQQVERSLAEYRQSLATLKVDVPGEWDLFDVVYRFKGTGSLGRLRFQLLVGIGEERHLLEVKEARQSALDEARGVAPSPHRAVVQTASIRRLQGSPWPLVAGTHLGRLSALCREIQPEEEKLGTDRFARGQGDADHALLLAYASQCGDVTARLHARESAPKMLGDPSFDPDAAAKGAVEFAGDYAAQVERDQRELARRKEEVAREIGL